MGPAFLCALSQNRTQAVYLYPLKKQNPDHSFQLTFKTHPTFYSGKFIYLYLYISIFKSDSFTQLCTEQKKPFISVQTGQQKPMKHLQTQKKKKKQIFLLSWLKHPINSKSKPKFRLRSLLPFSTISVRIYERNCVAQKESLKLCLFGLR